MSLKQIASVAAISASLCASVIALPFIGTFLSLSRPVYMNFTYLTPYVIVFDLSYGGLLCGAMAYLILRFVRSASGAFQKAIVWGCVGGIVYFLADTLADRLCISMMLFHGMLLQDAHFIWTPVVSLIMPAVVLFADGVSAVRVRRYAVVFLLATIAGWVFFYIVGAVVGVPEVASALGHGMGRGILFALSSVTWHTLYAIILARSLVFGERYVREAVLRSFVSGGVREISLDLPTTRIGWNETGSVSLRTSGMKEAPKTDFFVKLRGKQVAVSAAVGCLSSSRGPIVGTEVVSATDVLQYGDLKFAISVERLRLDLLQSFDF